MSSATDQLNLESKISHQLNLSLLEQQAKQGNVEAIRELGNKYSITTG